MNELITIIRSADPDFKNKSLEEFCENASVDELLDATKDLELYRKEESNLYNRVRALFFLYAIHRFYLCARTGIGIEGRIPYEAFDHLLKRRFEEAIHLLLKVQEENGANEGVSSALADAYHHLAFQTLADQVRISVRSTAGNKWMFRVGHPFDQPLKIHPTLLKKDDISGIYPCLHEATPVRMDLSHSGWSDIFFLGMDYPEGANVLNISIDLCIRNRTYASVPGPPIETWFRIIDESLLKLTSIDLGASSSIVNLSEVFDFAKDYLGLLKAGVIASGIIPPGMEGAGLPLRYLLEKMVGRMNIPREQAPESVLSNRELQVLVRLARGATTREVSEEMNLSQSTIETYRSHILEKLNLRNNSDLTRFAIRRGLIDLY